MNGNPNDKNYFQQSLFTQDGTDQKNPTLPLDMEDSGNDLLDFLEREDATDLAEAKDILAFSQEDTDSTVEFGNETGNESDTRENSASDGMAVAETLSPEDSTDDPLGKDASEDVTVSSPTGQMKKHLFPPLTRANLLRAALGFLRKLNPSGMGVNFNSGTYTHVDAGAYFLSTQRKKALVGRTIAVLIVSDTKRFQLDIACRRELQETLSLLINRRVKLEEIIKETEPEICDETLFSETSVWHFEESKNRDYQSCVSQIAKVQYSLVKGNVFERFISNQIADELYVVTTENLITPEEVPPMWGLVTINKDFKPTVIRKATPCETTSEKRLLFALRAATSAPDDFLFAKGITTDKNNNVTYHPVPRNRKPYSTEDC